MILDSLSNFNLYLPVHRLFPVVSAFIFGHDPRELATGRHPIGNDITVIIDVYATRSPENRFLEKHIRYIDIQILLSGIETIGVAPASACTITTPYHPEKDAEFLSGPMDFVTFHENDMAIFFPHDAHLPGTVSDGSSVQVKKMVIKVPVRT